MPNPTLRNCTVGVEDLAVDAEERRVMELINAHRNQHGVPALHESSGHTRAAAWMARDMATHDYFSHQDRLGRTPATRYPDCGARAGGENLAAGGNGSAEQTFQVWRDSPDHNAAMLSPDYRVAGIGRAFDPDSRFEWYWALALATGE